LAPLSSPPIGRQSRRWADARGGGSAALHKNHAEPLTTAPKSGSRRRRRARCSSVTLQRNSWHDPCKANASAGFPRSGGAMKLIIAVIKPFKLEDVREALAGAGVQGMTVSEVNGFGRQKGQTEIYRGAEYTTNMVPKIKVEVVVPAAEATKIIETIQQAAHTGSIGDGKIFVVDVSHAVRIRTGETDETAL
jgi:nitrogen regulatory protein P-II 2